MKNIFISFVHFENQQHTITGSELIMFRRKEINQ